MAAAVLSETPAAPSGRRAVVVPFERRVDVHRLVAGVRAGDERAARQFFDEYFALVRRTVVRILGTDGEVADVVQEVFFKAVRSIHLLRDPQALPDWVRHLAVGCAIDVLRQRRRRRWLRFVDPTELTTAAATVGTASRERDALQATYALLDRLAPEERAVFALRHVEGLELQEIGDACGFSLATTKRRLQAADRRFRLLAQQRGVLGEWLSPAPSEEP